MVTEPVATPKRIETDEAQALRSRRQHFAAPGGSHDRLVGFLARALPDGGGNRRGAHGDHAPVPARRSELSCLIAKGRVIDERLSVDNAMYRGRDDRAGRFRMMAGEAGATLERRGSGADAGILWRSFSFEDGPRLSAPVGSTISTKWSSTSRDYPVTLGGWLFDDSARGLGRSQAANHVGRCGVEGTIPAGTFSGRYDARRSRRARSPCKAMHVCE